MARQVWIGKASTSEPSSRRRYVFSGIKTRDPLYFWDKPIRYPVYWVGGVRRKDGASPIRARLWNCGNPFGDAKGEDQVKKSEVQSTEAPSGDGSTCSSVDVPVMGVELRSRVVPVDVHVNFLRGG